MVQVNQLSKREKEVVDLLLQGKTNKLIAFSLGISNRTVEFHLKNIYAKFQVNSRIELILKLGNTTGNDITDKDLGYSPVDKPGKITENRGVLNPHATSFRETISIIGEETKMKKQDIIIIVMGCICFGAAMALRDMMPDIWIRAIIAGAAFIFLGLTVGGFVKRKKKQKSQSSE